MCFARENHVTWMVWGGPWYKLPCRFRTDSSLLLFNWFPHSCRVSAVHVCSLCEERTTWTTCCYPNRLTAGANMNEVDRYGGVTRLHVNEITLGFQPPLI